ncbi:MAG: hypothetical protein ABH808_03270 [Candidatus Kuenenbacteria bacterium]
MSEIFQKIPEIFKNNNKTKPLFLSQCKKPKEYKDEFGEYDDIEKKSEKYKNNEKFGMIIEQYLFSTRAYDSISTYMHWCGFDINYGEIGVMIEKLIPKNILNMSCKIEKIDLNNRKCYSFPFDEFMDKEILKFLVSIDEKKDPLKKF